MTFNNHTKEHEILSDSVVGAAFVLVFSILFWISSTGLVILAWMSKNSFTMRKMSLLTYVLSKASFGVIFLIYAVHYGNGLKAITMKEYPDDAKIRKASLHYDELQATIFFFLFHGIFNYLIDSAFYLRRDRNFILQ